ncbi:hypothetical protein F4604DRAFT_536592 [Suillus subluteus]|nr:hypothetical protein F4604DRAFT_536592 [Suillus subluteus]
MFPQPPTSAIQSVLHVLFFSTLFKSNPRQHTDGPEKVLKVGALYYKCDIVNLRIPSPMLTDAANAQVGHRLGVYDRVHNI